MRNWIQEIDNLTACITEINLLTLHIKAARGRNSFVRNGEFNALLEARQELFERYSQLVGSAAQLGDIKT